MSGDLSGPIPEFAGPYENWIYGEGQPYAFPAIRAYDGGAISALAELPQPVVVNGIGDISGKTSAGKTVRLQAPVLWDGDGFFETRFLPLAVLPEDGLSDGTFMGPIAACLNGLVHTASQSYLGDGNSEFGARFRLNFPLHETSINRDFGQSDTSVIAWKPDRDTRSLVEQERQLTIIAIIDDAIPFAHRNLRKANGRESRVEYCWLQSARAEQDAGSDSVLFGREFTRSDIDRLIGECPDEDTLYAKAGAVDAQPQLGAALDRHVSHGSHVTDLAAGFDPSKLETPMEEIRIVTVQLPNTIAWDTSGFGKDMYMLAAFHYIFDRADRLAEAYYGRNTNGKLNRMVPLVVNFSYGFSGGPHDATVSGYAGIRRGIELEEAINEMVEARRQTAPTAVVMPSGNTFSDQLHANLVASRFEETGGAGVLKWRLQPNDRTPSYLEIWFPDETQPGDFEVVVEQPNGRRSRILVSAKQRDTGDPMSVVRLSANEDTPSIGQLSVDLFRHNRWRCLIAVAPTEPEPRTARDGSVTRLAAASAGVWTISVTRIAGIAPTEPVLCWIQRDADPDLFRSGSRQSYFDLPDHQQFADDGSLVNEDANGSAIRRFGSISGLVTGRTITAVSGFRGTARNGFQLSVGVPADYASAGPVVPQGSFSKAVAVSALTDVSNTTPGILAAGTRSGAYGRVVGTSTAAPQVARVLAHKFATTPLEEIKRHEVGNYVGLLEMGIEVDGNSVGNVAHPLVRLGTRFIGNERFQTP